MGIDIQMRCRQQELCNADWWKTRFYQFSLFFSDFEEESENGSAALLV